MKDYVEGEHMNTPSSNKDKTQAMIFGKGSRQSNPAINNLGFDWVKEIKILGGEISWVEWSLNWWIAWTSVGIAENVPNRNKLF